MSHPDPRPADRPVQRSGAPLVLALVLVVGGAGAAAGYVAAVRGPGWLPGRTLEPPAAPEPAPQPAIDARLADIQARLVARQAAEDRTDAIVVANAEVQALDERLARIEQRQERALQAAAAALAIGALDQAAQESEPFLAELALAERSLPPSEDLRRLAAVAPAGAPSRAALAAAFPEAMRRALAAQQAGGPAGDGWLARLARTLAAVVTVRRLDPSGAGVDAVLARAEARLSDGDLEGALSDLSALPPSERHAMAGWLERARRRAEVDRGVAALRVQALRRLDQERAALAAPEPLP